MSTRKRMIAYLVAFSYLVGALSAVHAILNVRTAPGAIAWSISLVTVPFIAVPAYWVLGRSKFKGQIDAYEVNKDEIDQLILEIKNNLEVSSVKIESSIPSYEAIQKLSGNDATSNNRAELLINGEATFDSILSGISAAEDYVIVQFYIIRDDDLGRRLQSALIERAKAGVRVFLLYDEIGSLQLPESYIDKLRSVGVEVSAFGTRQGRRNRFQLNFRNHRKIVIVDGVRGWIGGHNVGDEYLGLDPKLSPWRDTHMKLEGPVVIQLQKVVAGDWYWATRELPTFNWVPQNAEGSDMKAMIIPSAPTQQLEVAGLMFVHALNNAKKRAWFSAPYFVPDEAVMKAMELAALRGVDVRILIPATGDSVLTWHAAYYYIEQLKGLGIRFFEYGPGFLHEKVGLIDDNASLVGTANFDNRSFRLNFEVTAFIYDEDFATQMEQMFLMDFEHSIELDPDSLSERGFWWRFAVSLSRLASPVL